MYLIFFKETFMRLMPYNWLVVFHYSRGKIQNELIILLNERNTASKYFDIIKDLQVAWKVRGATKKSRTPLLIFFSFLIWSFIGTLPKFQAVTSLVIWFLVDHYTIFHIKDMLWALFLKLPILNLSLSEILIIP
jgi:hypothetical protein